MVTSTGSNRAVGAGRAHAVAVLLVTMGIGVLALSSCSSGSSHSARAGSTSTTSVTDPRCELSGAQAVTVLGSKAKLAAPPGNLGVPKPIARCEYAAGGATLQLSVYAGAAPLAQFRQLLSTAPPAPELGPDAYCNAGPGTKLTAVSCLFLKDSNTYVLGLLIPNGQADASTRDHVRSVADAIARSSSGSTTTS
jgi:hypothetical protein